MKDPTFITEFSYTNALPGDQSWRITYSRNLDQ